MILMRLFGVRDITAQITRVRETVGEMFGLDVVLNVGPGLVPEPHADAARELTHLGPDHEVVQLRRVGQCS